VIHEALEGSGTVAYAKKHDSRFKESTAYFKGSLPLVFFPDLNIVVSSVNVKFAEYFHALQVFYALGQVG
jgi:hypothetical protein